MDEIEKLKEKMASMEVRLAQRDTGIGLNTRWLVACSAIILIFLGYTNLVSIPKSAQDAAQAQVDKIVPGNIQAKLNETLSTIEEQKEKAIRLVQALNSELEQRKTFALRTFKPAVAKLDQDMKVRLIDTKEGFCFLTKVSGKFMGYGECARVYVQDNNWWLQAKTGAASDYVEAEACAIVFPK